MKILYRIPSHPLKIKRPVAAIGIFDGVHRGHQAIVRRAVARARAIHGTPMVLTFYPHPAVILAPSSAPDLLLSLEQRLDAFAALGIRTALVIPFTKKISRWSPEYFLQHLLVKLLGVREVIVGHDFGFGKDRAGSVKTLREAGRKYGFAVHVVPPYRIKKERLASRTIRDLIRKGNLTKAGLFLGRPVSVEGKVVKGSGRGKKLGFPTANIQRTAGVVPPMGVYAVRAILRTCADELVAHGMANLGFRPTFFKKKQDPLLEVHLFGMEKNVIGRLMRVEFLKFLRPERKFPSVDALRRQLLRDATHAKRVTCSLS